MGRKKRQDPGAGLRAQAQANLDRAVAEIRGVSLPDYLRQEELYRRQAEQAPELAGLLDAEELERSKDLEFDPRLQEAQMAALESLRERGRGGLSEEDKLKYDDVRESLASDFASQQADISRRAAEQGGGSGQEMAQRLMAQQSAAQQAAKFGRGQALDALQAKMQSEQTAGAMAGQMSAQDIARQQSNRIAQQQIAEFNAQNRQQANRYNLGQQQNINNQRAALQQQLYGNLAGQQSQMFDDKMRRATGVANAYSGHASGQMTAAGQIKPQQSSLGGALQGAGAGAAVGTSIMPGWGTAIGAGLGAVSSYFADGGVAGEPLSPEELLEAQDINSQIQAEDENVHYPEEEGREFSYADRQAFEDALRRQEALDAGYANGGVPGIIAKNGDVVSVDGGFIFPGEEDEYAGDRVDAKVNRGEMILNAEQQQRILDVLRGKASPEILHNGEDVVETPEAAQNRGFLKVLEMIGKK
jgi:hypothetical protein